MRNIFFYLSLLFIFSCNSKNQEANDPLIASEKTGKELALEHCGACHENPKPSDLTKEIWSKSVLPRMALYMGLDDPMTVLMKLPENEMMTLLEKGVYPSNPRMHPEDWKKIQAYFKILAPEKLISAHKVDLVPTSIFDAELLDPNSKEVICTKFINNNLFISKADKAEVEIASGLNFNNKRIMNGKAILDVAFTPNYGYVYLEAVNMNPHDQALGYLKSEKGDILISNLRRPVSLLINDFNEDKKPDFLIASFGNHFGDLSWYDGKNLNTPHVLIEAPGARNMVFEDFDGDGKKDIIALMTQAREGLWVFKNIGKGDFEPKEILKFPSYYGSSYFEYLDIDGDSDKDFVISMGDNADLSIIHKPYHGIRIYENDGKNNFKEKLFISFNGLTQTASADYDRDGDVDIAAICHFPDFEKGSSFVFLENVEGNYVGKTIPKLQYTKWLTMEKADIDGDADDDLVLGAFSRESRKDNKNLKGVYILKNKTK
jgi:FG-GAP-like repeat